MYSYYDRMTTNAWLGLVNCPTWWSLLFVFGFLYWSSSWRWRPNIGVCRLFWPLLRAGMAVLTQFFSKMYFLYVSPSRQKKLTDFFLVLPPEKAVFFRGGPDFQEWGCPAKLLEIALGKYEARLSEILTGDHCCSRQGNKFTSVFKYFWRKSMMKASSLSSKNGLFSTLGSPIREW